MGEKSRVLIVAGNRLLREALARVLQKRGDFNVVGAVPYAEGLLESFSGESAEVVILDSVTIDLAGHQFIRQAKQSSGNPQVLLIGMPNSERAFLEAVRAGSQGYVLDEASATELLAAVRSVAAGQSVCPPAMCSVLFKQVANPARGQMPSIQVRVRLGLTRREQQLIPLIAQGLTNKEIAMHFRISEQTVKNHVHRMLQKVGASDRLAVVDYCRDQGFQVF